MADMEMGVAGRKSVALTVDGAMREATQLLVKAVAMMAAAMVVNYSAAAEVVDMEVRVERRQVSDDLGLVE